MCISLILVGALGFGVPLSDAPQDPNPQRVYLPGALDGDPVRSAPQRLSFTASAASHNRSAVSFQLIHASVTETP